MEFFSLSRRQPIDNCLLQLCIGAAEEAGLVEVVLGEEPNSTLKMVISPETDLFWLTQVIFSYIDESGDEIPLGVFEYFVARKASSYPS